MAKAKDVIIAVMNEVQAIAKKERNQAQGFNFRGIDSVLNAVGPALRNAGGFIIPQVISRDYETLPAKNGGSLNVARLVVQFSVHGTEGDPIHGTVAAEAFDSGDKATAKAMSVALRTFLLQTLALPTDEPDPDMDSYEIAAARDWKSEIAALTDVAAARVLYNEAQRSKAGAAVLKAITDKVATLG